MDAHPTTHTLSSSTAVTATTTATVRGRGRPRKEEGPVLDENRILTALLDITQREGVQALNMRRIAKELGVSTRLLYRHVSGKEQLIDMLADAILAKHAPDLSSDKWETRLRNIACSVRQALANYPGIAAAMLEDSTRSYDESYPLQLRTALLKVFQDAGLRDDQGQLVYLQFAITVLGGLVLAEGAHSSSRSPSLKDSIDQSIDLGLDLLVLGVQRMVAQQPLTDH